MIFKHKYNIINLNNDTILSNELDSQIKIPNTPALLQSAYNITPIAALTGKRSVVITIIIAFHYPQLQSDFNKFCQRFGLPSKTLEIINLGTTAYDPTTGWQIEECLDVQWSYAMNPNAHIRVIESLDNSNSMYDAVSYASNPNHFKNNPYGMTDIISMSWGAYEESGENQFNSIFSNPNICYFAATGDDIIISYPAVCSNVIACGGTTLYYSNANVRNETTWDVAGAGVSQYIEKPDYQTNIAAMESYTNRCVPDICAIANPTTGVPIIYSGFLGTVGGTSLSTPVISGIISNMIQKFINSGQNIHFTTVLNSRNSTLLQNILYKIIYSSTNYYSSCFYDIKSGLDGSYYASTGFDIATGLGSINCGNLLSIISNLYPTISSFSPNNSKTTGGILITINGTNFNNTTTVKIGPIIATQINIISSTIIQCVSPSNISGKYNIIVSNNDIFNVLSENTITYQVNTNPPIIKNIYPNYSILKGGYVITILGDNFTDQCKIKIGDVFSPSVNFISENKITCISPSFKLRGIFSIKVMNPEGPYVITNNSKFRYI
jgi:subtilase family serine protease